MYEIMALLLEWGVSLVISTKGVVPGRFVDLFARYNSNPPAEKAASAPLPGVQEGLAAAKETAPAPLPGVQAGLAAAKETAPASLPGLQAGLTPTKEAAAAPFPCVGVQAGLAAARETAGVSFPRVCVQVGITTADDGARALMEPRASSVRDRRDSLRRLRAAGVAAEARLDPLVPGRTDTLDSFCALLAELARTGVSDAAASYMFLRWGIRPPRDLKRRDWSFQEMRKIYTHKVTQYCGGGTIWLPPPDYRRERYALLKDVAAAHGLRVRLCRCKNPELTNECCNPLPKTHPRKSEEAGFLPEAYLESSQSLW